MGGFGRTLKVTNLDKVLFPGAGGRGAAHEARPGPVCRTDRPGSLPYLAGRALNLHRYPDGAHRKGVWQKEVPDHAPGWLPRWDNPDADPGERTT